MLQSPLTEMSVKSPPSPIPSPIGEFTGVSSVQRLFSYRSQLSSSSPGEARVALGEGLDASLAETLYKDVQQLCCADKDQLQRLSDRFASYIEKVRSLEQQYEVKVLEINQMRQNRAGHAVDMCHAEMQGLRMEVERLTNCRASVEVQRDNLAAELENLKLRLSEEIRSREVAERNLLAAGAEVDSARLLRVELERRLKTKEDEMNFFKKMYDEEINNQQRLMVNIEQNVAVDGYKPELTSALQEIRAQYNAISAKHISEVKAVYQSTVSYQTKIVTQYAEELRQVKIKLLKNQGYAWEIGLLKETNKLLSKQKMEIESRYQQEVNELLGKIFHLEAEIRSMNENAAFKLSQSQNLLNSKFEITTYSTQLDGTESSIAHQVPDHTNVSVTTQRSLISQTPEVKGNRSK